MSAPTIRPFETSELAVVLDLINLAFADEGAAVAGLVEGLAQEVTESPMRSFVATTGSEVLGCICFSPISLGMDNSILVYWLAPLGVHPDHQGLGVGRALVEGGIEELRRQGVNLVLVYGDPAYYGKFGFTASRAESFVPPYKLAFTEGWLGLQLNPHESLRDPVEIECVASLRDPTLW